MPNINLNATSFYWSPALRARYEREGIYVDLLARRSRLGQDITNIVTDIDLTQRQKAKKLSKVIENFADGQMDVILAILDTKFGILRTPLKKRHHLSWLIATKHSRSL